MGDGRGTTIGWKDYRMASRFIAGLRLEGVEEIDGNDRGFSRALEKALKEEDLAAFRDHFTFVDGRAGRYALEISKMLYAGGELGLFDTMDDFPFGTTYRFNMGTWGSRFAFLDDVENLPGEEDFRRLGKKFYEYLMEDTERGQ